MVCDTIFYLNEAIKQKKNVLVEGANAVMLDLDFGNFLIFLKFFNFLKIF